MAQPSCESRSYIHETCQEETEVSGPEFASISDPLVGMKKTMCAACHQYLPVAEFKWADTGERLTDYYSRYCALASPLVRCLGSRAAIVLWALVGMALGAACGVAVGQKIGWLWGSIAVMVLTIIGALLALIGENLVFRPVLMRHAYGVGDCRDLK